MMIEINELFDINYTRAKTYLQKYTYPWQALGGIKELIIELGKNLGDDFEEVNENVWVHKTAKVYPSAYLGSPCIIDEGSEIRHCAFIRESALIGKNCVVGNSVELKNVILFDNVQVPHYNYVGDSILGYKAHMGAGSITSNVRSDKRNVIIKCGDTKIETNLKKVGAMLGDGVEVGCNAVLNPGTILCKNSFVYPTSCVRGVVPNNYIYKNNGEMVEKRSS